MNKIDELIQKLCPDGVEFKKLSSLGRRNKGVSITAGRMKELHRDGSPIRIFAGGKTIADVQGYAIPAKSIINNPSIIVKSRGHIGFTYYDKPFTHKNELWSYNVKNESVDQKFVYYYLLTQVSNLQNIARAKSVKLPQLSVSDTDRLMIPIPPIEIQKKIANILDKFTQLEAELSAELEARRKQYDFYRDQLLTFDKNDKEVEWLKLGDIGELTIGNGLQKKDFVENGIGCIHYGQIYTYYNTFAHETKSYVHTDLAKKLKKAKHGDVLIAGVSENIEDVCKPLGWLGGEICISGDMFVFRHNQNTKYITYLLQTSDFQKYKRQHAQGAKVTRVKREKILNYKVPIPTIKEQSRIASILDKFDKLTNNISEGLPAEINARRKQYEYYRDKLLTFKELPS